MLPRTPCGFTCSSSAKLTLGTEKSFLTPSLGSVPWVISHQILLSLKNRKEKKKPFVLLTLMEPEVFYNFIIN